MIIWMLTLVLIQRKNLIVDCAHENIKTRVLSQAVSKTGGSMKTTNIMIPWRKAV